MSKTSAKQRYVQLMEWLEVTKKKSNTTNKPLQFSKADYYKSKGV